MLIANFERFLGEKGETVFEENHYVPIDSYAEDQTIDASGRSNFPLMHDSLIMNFLEGAILLLSGFATVNLKL
jgi:hypothetical protein